MVKEIVVECVVKPVLSVTVSMATIAVVGIVTSKIDKLRKAKEEPKEKPTEI